SHAAPRTGGTNQGRHGRHSAWFTLSIRKDARAGDALVEVPGEQASHLPRKSSAGAAAFRVPHWLSRLCAPRFGRYSVHAEFGQIRLRPGNARSSGPLRIQDSGSPRPDQVFARSFERQFLRQRRLRNQHPCSAGPLPFREGLARRAAAISGVPLPLPARGVIAHAGNSNMHMSPTVVAEIERNSVPDAASETRAPLDARKTGPEAWLDSHLNVAVLVIIAAGLAARLVVANRSFLNPD